jgi:hypothetical protein
LETVKEIIAWIVVVLVGLIGLAVVWALFTGKINLEKLISEEDGKGSMSRLQFLIFTFVIAGTLFMIIVSSDPPAFPEEIPAGIFAVLGISGGTYVLGKGVQTTKETEQARLNNQLALKKQESTERVELARIGQPPSPPS